MVIDPSFGLMRGESNPGYRPELYFSAVELYTGSFHQLLTWHTLGVFTGLLGYSTKRIYFL